jgi:hypothetical protein
VREEERGHSGWRSVLTVREGTVRRKSCQVRRREDSSTIEQEKEVD